ncbi:MAG: PEP/pyruvate-binding domain-containing protein [Candidatus Lokiarchaeota archaeon]|nr:PEP/pyruvate-binding domain-containing protein [Candidatus Lokiarchaeota archaeon]
MEYITSLKEGKADTCLFGGKASNIFTLIKNEVNVPSGYAISTKAFALFLEESRIKPIIKEIFAKEYNPKEVIEISTKIKKLFLTSEVPSNIISEIQQKHIKEFSDIDEHNSYVVRSSANYEDSNNFSFAGQAQSFLNIRSITEIISSIKMCWASLFSPQILLYLIQLNKRGFNITPLNLEMAIIVQRMLKPQVSGVLFTANVINNNKDQMMINSTWGLGETITNNTIIPDMIIIQKNGFEIMKITIGKKEKTSVANPKGDSTILIDTERKYREICSLNSSQLMQIHNLGLKLEALFNYPQDIEWAIENNTLYILQSRPITTLLKK